MTHAHTVPRLTLASAKRGVLSEPLVALVYGVEGVGKSTLAAGAPSPFFISADSGTAQLDVTRVSVKSWLDVLGLTREIATTVHAYKTLVIDPINFVEPMLFASLCDQNKWTSIEDAGFGKGYTAAVDQWRVLLSELERVRERGINILLLAHSMVRTFKNPEGEDFDRYHVSMHEKGAALLKQWCQNVLFARHESFVSKEKNKAAKGLSTGARVLHTTWQAAFDAKNRLCLPETIPLSWVDLVAAAEAARTGASDVSARITEIASSLGDPALVAKIAKAVSDAGNDVGRLSEVLNRVEMRAAAVAEKATTT